MEVVKSVAEFEALKGKDLEVFFDVDLVNLKDVDFANVKSLKFKDGCHAVFNKSKNIPADTDVSNCARVDFLECDLNKVSSLKFKDNSQVTFYGIKKLPADIDVSKCDFVSFRGCDLKGVNKLDFADNSAVDLSYSTNLDSCLDGDFKKCNTVWLCGCDLENFKQSKKLKFKDMSGVVFSKTGAPNIVMPTGLSRISVQETVLPEELDVSTCSAVVFDGCNMASVKDVLRFRKASRISLDGAYNFQNCLDFDFSVCSYVDLSGCNLSTVSPIFGDGAAVRLNNTALSNSIQLDNCCSVDFSGSRIPFAYKFNDGAEVIFEGCKSFPSSMYVSNCSVVNFNNCNLSGVYFVDGFKEGVNINFEGAALPDKIVFPKDSIVNLAGAKKFPSDLNFKLCDTVRMDGCDFSRVNSLIFGAKTKHNLKDVAAMPAILEFLESDTVDLSDCDLSNVKSMKFKKGAVVNMRGATLPRRWDVSGYDDVTFDNVHAGSDVEIKFRDKKQYRKFKNECFSYSAKTMIKGKRTTNHIGTKILLGAAALMASSIVLPRACDSFDNNETGDGKSRTEETRVGNGGKKDDDTADFGKEEEKVRTRIKIKRNKERSRRNGERETLPVETEEQTKAEIEKILKEYYGKDRR